MNLAEALLERAGLAAEINVIAESLNKNIWAAESAAPWFLGQITLLESKRLTLQKLIVNINFTNTMTGITEIVAQRESLKAELRTWETLSQYIEHERESKAVKVSMLSKTELQDKVASVQKATHNVNLQLQRLNWESELQIRI